MTCLPSWCGFLRRNHGNKTTTIRGKLSGVRWAHIKDLRKNPFTDMESLKDWLADATKMDGPVEPKLPVPVSIIMMIIVCMEDTYDLRSLKAAILMGYWFLLRSVEYLAEDSGGFDPDRSLTWGDLRAMVEDSDGETQAHFDMSHILTGNAGSKWRAIEMADLATQLKAGKSCDLSGTFFSDKNSLSTCTRTLPSTAGSDLCVVQAVADLYEAHVKLTGKAPNSKAAVFAKADGSVYTRGYVSDILKEAAAVSGVPKARIASHSLRRGGASTYAAAGISDKAIQRWGRWTSSAYQSYVYPHMAQFAKGLKKAMHVVPRFERN
jgi:hypothetical protein